jgi:branched-chain amino acid transport system permease protein
MSGYFEGILVLLAINTVFAYGAYLPLAAGQLNIGLAGFAAIGAYTSAYLSNQFAVHPLIAILLGAILSGLVGLAVAVPVLRTRGIYLALATFALGQIIRAAILNLELIGGAAGYPVTDSIRLPAVLGFAVGVVVLVSLLFGMRFGIAVRAVQDDERVADLMGVEVRGFQIAAFGLGAAIAGIGGGLYAHQYGYIEAQYFNVGLSITIVLYVILGGTQTTMGPLIGATIFTLLPELLRQSASWRYVVFAAAVILLMALRPQGLLTRGQLERLFAWHHPRSPERAADRLTGHIA